LISVYWSWSVPPSNQQNHHSKCWRDINKTIDRVELAGIAAALINEHTHIKTGRKTLHKLASQILLLTPANQG
jgi:hypothetical protein